MCESCVRWYNDFCARFSKTDANEGFQLLGEEIRKYSEDYSKAALAVIERAERTGKNKKPDEDVMRDINRSLNRLRILGAMVDGMADCMLNQLNGKHEVSHIEPFFGTPFNSKIPIGKA